MKPAHLKQGAKGHRAHPNKMEGRKPEADCFMYNMVLLVGCPCEVTVRDGRKYDGVFSAYDKHELLVESAHLIGEGATDESAIEESVDCLVIPSERMVFMRFRSVDNNYATREFATDTAISGNRNSNTKERELTPWDGPEVETHQDMSLESRENGWEAKDMFKKNEEKYGVTSSFSHDLKGYTTQIDKKNDSFKAMEQQASQLANEIERQTATWERSELENGEDEEEAFSAVVRPSRNSASHSNANSNINSPASSASAGSSDKYIPPSRRSGNSSHQNAAPQNAPANNNGAQPVNNNSNTNPRNKVYGQNQNPRGGYGMPQNSYHDRRNNYDNRRGPPPNQQQYPPPGGHSEGRRMEDAGPGPGRGDPGRQQQRMPPKGTDRGDRRGGGRDDSAKLKEFGSNFKLQQTSDMNPPRRGSGNQPHPSSQTVNTSVPPGGGEPSGHAGRNPTPPSATPQKSHKDKVNPPSSSQQQSAGDAREKGSPPAPALATPVSSTNTSMLSSTESTPTSGANSADMQTPTGDSKCSESDKKHKFTFNPNAKEFNPTAKSFSSPSSTPPRPPSTPAQATTPQMMPHQQMHPYMVPMIYAHPQSYAQPAALTPSPATSASSGGANSRHTGGGRKGGGMLGVPPPRSDMTPPIQVTGPPLFVPASLPGGGGPPQYYVPQGGPFHQVVLRPPPTMNVYPTDGNGSAQMHQQVHFMSHNGAPPQNSGHPNSNTPSNTPNPPSQTPVVSANGPAYNQVGGNPGFPYGGVIMGYPQVPHGQMITLPYVPTSTTMGGPYYQSKGPTGP